MSRPMQTRERGVTMVVTRMVVMRTAGRSEDVKSGLYAVLMVSEVLGGGLLRIVTKVLITTRLNFGEHCARRFTCRTRAEAAN